MSSSSAASPPLTRCCFVTIGATVGFRRLLDEVVVEGPFVAELKALGYTDLVVQCGPDVAYLEDRLRGGDGYGAVSGTKGVTGSRTKDGSSEPTLQVQLFEYSDNITAHMAHTLARPGKSLQGVVVCHGGRYLTSGDGKAMLS